MKQVILLVGPQGAGKSTHANHLIYDDGDHGLGTIYVNQDTQGKNHLKIFQEAIQNNKNIIVDRINHTRDQRDRYLKPAKDAGYQTKIIVMNQHFASCYEALIKRTNHPTLNGDDEKSVLNGLSMYFTQYEYVCDSEADEVIRTAYDPFMLDISNVTKNRRTILIGDVHGCYTELKKLLKQMNYSPYEDVLVFAGDLIDRGPDINLVVDFVKKNKGGMVYSVMSNHENKYLRYLRGNKVSTFGLRDTLTQIPDSLEMRMWLESLPFVIKTHKDKYVVHAGVHPYRSMERQSKDALLYARTFNPETGNMTGPAAQPWFNFSPTPSKTVYFGHQIYEKANVAHWARSLDGGCVHGGVLRAITINRLGQEDQIFEVQSNFEFDKKSEDEYHNNYHESLTPYETLVQDKTLNKSEHGHLVLYKYSEKCSYGKEWNEYTRKSRGIIFDKRTGECIARPFEKFFNLGEMKETFVKNLPEGPYEVYDKADGSLGILYWNKEEPNIATAGSFFSDQAIWATKFIREEKNVKELNRDWTLLFEIIYPTNKIVVDYKGKKDLILLAGFDRHSGTEISRSQLEQIASELNLNIIEKYNLSIDEMLTLQKTMSKDREGFVVKFSNGLRLKIKGEEYLRIHRAISNTTPLNIWKELKNGKLTAEYKASLPEELLPEIEAIEAQLNKEYQRVGVEVFMERMTLCHIVPLNAELTPTMRKMLGLYLKDHSKEMKHSSAIFPLLLQKEEFTDYVTKQIRPKGNLVHD